MFGYLFVSILMSNADTDVQIFHSMLYLYTALYLIRIQSNVMLTEVYCTLPNWTLAACPMRSIYARSQFSHPTNTDPRPEKPFRLEFGCLETHYYGRPTLSAGGLTLWVNYRWCLLLQVQL